MGKNRIVAETGAGQHGVATATACALLGIEAVIYMGSKDYERQKINVARMKLLGAEVEQVNSGSMTLKDAINEAIRDWVTNVNNTHYLIGSVVGPHPYPEMVRNFQSIIGEETKQQFELIKKDGWALEWKGCIDVDGQYYFNDVSLDTSGNFYASHMFDSDFSMIRALWNVFAKSDTGMAVKWTQDNKFEELMYTAGSFPNGIALDQKNNNLIVNYNLGDKSILFDLNSKRPLGIYAHNSPDNVVIQDGFAWVTNHDHSVTETLGCGESANCTLPFSVNKLSLLDLSLVESYKFKSKNMGVGTVGLPHDGSLWIGSYRSDRIAEGNLSLSE